MPDRSPDLSDPGVRAARRLRSRRRGRRAARLALAALLVLAGLAVLAASAAQGEAVWGGAVGALALFILAGAASPRAWSPEEAEHHRLDRISREVRSATPAPKPWPRFVAWAEPAGDRVGLWLIRQAPGAHRYSQTLVGRFRSDEVGAAIRAMDELRTDAEEKELAAYLAHHEPPPPPALQIVEDERAEAGEQAAALARALRRP